MRARRPPPLPRAVRAPIVLNFLAEWFRGPRARTPEGDFVPEAEQIAPFHHAGR